MGWQVGFRRCVGEGISTCNGGERIQTMEAMHLPLKRKFGQASWRIEHDVVEFWMTEKGGMLAPAYFELGDGRKIQPFSVAPWAEERVSEDIPPLLEALRGDFFCQPFGGNEKAWRGEAHPPHGESANADWEFVDFVRNKESAELRLRLEAKVREGVIDKRVSVRRGERALYCEHLLSGFRGSMPIGNHPCLRFESEGRISVGGWREGQVLPVDFEDPAMGGYSALKRGATFDSLERVPMANGEVADLTRYPARNGFEDLVMLKGMPGRRFGWSAVTFPSEGWAFLQLKNAKVLRHTVLWHSNGGRHYAPWSGRHRNVLGLEETTSYFHLGLADSSGANPISREGYPTVVQLSPKKPLRVPYIFAVVEIPKEFDRVAEVVERSGEVELISVSGKKARAKLDLEFVK